MKNYMEKESKGFKLLPLYLYTDIKENGKVYRDRTDRESLNPIKKNL